MTSFTLDTNCILDLVNDHERASFLRPLILSWKAGRIDLAVVAISGSENQRGGVANSQYSAFETLLEKAGLRGIKELLPPFVWDLGYWDHMVYMEEQEIPQLMQLSKTLFPNLVPPPIEGQMNSKWRNQQCDILVAWTHAKYKQDYLVTSDERFHRKEGELKALGIGEIVCPETAAEIVRSL